jgi:uncharacterized protein YkwD
MNKLPLALTLVLAINTLPASLGMQTAGAGYQNSLLRLHNEERERRNLPRFRSSGALIKAATDYSRVMSENNHFDHIGIDSSTPDDRIRAAGFSGRATGENIAAGFTSASTVFRGWMNSPGHRRNIRSRLFDQIGFGKTGTYWVTNFGG